MFPNSLTPLGLFLKSLIIFHDIQPTKIKAQQNICTKNEQKRSENYKISKNIYFFATGINVTKLAT